jgi:hypothetical protein
VASTKALLDERDSQRQDHNQNLRLSGHSVVQIGSDSLRGGVTMSWFGRNVALLSLLGITFVIILNEAM